MTVQSYSMDDSRAWIEVDLGAMLRNGSVLERRAGIPLLPMVKAGGYGLGAIRVARALERLDPWGFGVGTVAEGEELRAAGIDRPILVFTPLLRRLWPAARAARLTPALHRADDIRGWVDEGGGAWHLAIDTGMNRAGVHWDEVHTLRDLLRDFPPAGVFTHFHSAERDDGTRQLQERRFREAVDALPVRPALVHAENSAAIEHGGASPYTIMRPGAFLYGLDSDGAIAVEPVVTLRARVVDLRTVPPGETVSYEGSWRATEPRRIATLSVGYGDGYCRSLSNRGHVLLHGSPAPIVGMVTMDMTMVDVTDIQCEVGDAATLMGADGDATLTLRDVARAAGLSPYEILIGLRARLPRRYLDEPGTAE